MKYSRFCLYGLRIYGLFGHMVNFLLVPNGIPFYTIYNFGYKVYFSVIWSNLKVMNNQKLAKITSHVLDELIPVALISGLHCIQK